jgi:hypothetical protein
MVKGRKDFFLSGCLPVSLAILLSALDVSLAILLSALDVLPYCPLPSLTLRAEIAEIKKMTGPGM